MFLQEGNSEAPLTVPELKRSLHIRQYTHVLGVVTKLSDITTARAIVDSMSEDRLHQLCHNSTDYQGGRAKLYFLHLVTCKVACFVFQS